MSLISRTPPTAYAMNLALVRRCLSARMLGLLDSLQRQGVVARDHVVIVERAARLHAIIEFEGGAPHDGLQLPLDLWPPS